MVSVFTTNLAVEQPANGDYPGAWDVPVNSNMTVFDLAVGTTQQISLAAGSVTLSTAQARSAFLVFNGNLVADVTVTIPGLSSSPGTLISGKAYTVQNQCGNSSAFSVTLATTVAGAWRVGAPPYEPFDIIIEGTNSAQPGYIKFRNLDRVGTYWDYAGSSVPAWVTNCTVAPYLNCDGTAFSSGTYPALATILGGTTLPDSRGRFRAATNQGQSRITSSGSGLDGNTIFSSGGSEYLQVHQHGVVDAGHTHNLGIYYYTTVQGGTGAPGVVNVVAAGSTTNFVTASGVTGISIANSGQGNYQNIPPAYIGGLTLIRAA